MQPGDLLVAAVDNNGPAGQSMTPPPGWSLVPASSNPLSPTATLTTWWYYKVATSADAGSTATWSWSDGSLYGSAVLADYAGVDPASPFDGVSLAGGSGTQPTNGGVTTSGTGDGLTAWAVGVGTPTMTSGALTEEASEDVQQSAGEWDGQQAAAGATGSYSWSLSAAHSWTTGVIALRPSTATPSPTTTSPTPTATPTTSTSPIGSTAPTGVGLNVEPSYRPWRWAGGPNPDSWWDPQQGAARVAAEMPLLAGANAKMVRVEFPWTFIETAKGAYNWSQADDIVAAAVKNNVQLQAVVAFCPSWEGQPNCVPNASDFQSFITALATRYKGKIHVWEFGNEPDISRYFNGSEAQWITSMLNPGYAAVKAVDSTNVVVSSGMAYPSNLGWIDTLKADGARFDVQAYHDYPSSASQVNSDGWALRDRMNSDGYANVPLWLDEFGYEENSTNDSTQQSWLTTVLTPGANPATFIKWYNLRDDAIYCGATSICNNNYYGLMDQNLNAKQGYSTFAQLAAGWH